MVAVSDHQHELPAGSCDPFRVAHDDPSRGRNETALKPSESTLAHVPGPSTATRTPGRSAEPGASLRSGPQPPAAAGDRRQLQPALHVDADPRGRARRRIQVDAGDGAVVVADDERDPVAEHADVGQSRRVPQQPGVPQLGAEWTDRSRQQLDPPRTSCSSCSRRTRRRSTSSGSSSTTAPPKFDATSVSQAIAVRDDRSRLARPNRDAVVRDGRPRNVGNQTGTRRSESGRGSGPPPRLRMRSGECVDDGYVATELRSRRHRARGGGRRRDRGARRGVV